MSHCRTASSGCHGATAYEARSGTAIMSGSAGLWPIGPAAKPAKPAPPPMRTSRASTGTILAQGLPCMSTNMAKKNPTPSDSAFAARSSMSDMDTLRCVRCRRWPLPPPGGVSGAAQRLCSGGQEPLQPLLTASARVDVVYLYDTMLRAYAGRAAFGKMSMSSGQHPYRASARDDQSLRRVRRKLDQHNTLAASVRRVPTCSLWLCAVS